MKRRDALKNIGLAVGYSAIIPSALSILQSCKTEEKEWIPVFFSTDESIVIKNLVDLILPKTDNIPGALDVNVPEFIDLYASKVYTGAELETYKLGIASIIEQLPIPETGAKDLHTHDYKSILTKYLRANASQRKQYELHEDTTYTALVNLRAQAVWAFKTSMEIGENVLAYDPVPGIQKGCISVNEATGGREWSL